MTQPTQPTTPRAAGPPGLLGWLSRALRQVPTTVQSRALVLLLGLSVIKLVLLAGLGKHLYEIHWRIEPSHPAPINWLYFLTFVALGTWSLWSLARHCRLQGIRTVRTANAVVLGLGLAFIFFRFHEGDKTYLYPVLSGILQPADILTYLKLDLFFRPPYLAFLLGGYVFLYYLMVRTGREGWMFHITAIAAGLYALLFLRDLRLLGDTLLLVDTVGLALLLLARPLSKGFKLRWLAAPVAWTILFLALFRLAAPELGRTEPSLNLLFQSAIVIFLGATLLAWRQHFLGAWIPRLPFYFAAFLLLANDHYPLGANFGNLLNLAVGTPRYFASELFLFALVLAGGTAWLRLRRKAPLWWLDILILLALALALVDLRLTQIMGVRLGWDLVEFADSPKMMWRMARPYLPVVLLGLAFMAAAYAFAISRLQRRLNLSRHSLAARPLSPGAAFAALLFLLLCLASLALAPSDKAQGQSCLSLVLNSPWLKRSDHPAPAPAEFLAQARQLGWHAALTPAAIGVADTKRTNLNLVVIFLESSYNKHLSLFGSSEPTQPELSRYRDRMELFPNFFSAFAGSIHARFSTFTSLYPVQDFNAFTRRRVPVKSLFEALHDAGFSNSLFYSSFLDYTGFRDFLKQRGLDELYDADTMPGQRKTEPLSWGLREEETLEAMRARIRQYATAKQRFSLTYVPAAPHYPYDGIPASFMKYKARVMGDFTPLYLNELLYIDWVMATILDELKTAGILDQTVVLITNDHGEMLGDNGNPIGHGWVVTPELANTPLIILDPLKRGYRINSAVGSQVDFLPTALELVGVPLPTNQLYQGRSLLAPLPSDRILYCNSGQEFGMVVSNQFLCGARPASHTGSLEVLAKTYSISNIEAKTLFSLSPDATNHISIAAFDAFQENLLHNYAVICRELNTFTATNGTDVKR
jgi:phosphoglycerol transferase MdoB-like AlkP superfamily enzyme